jgi:hypothetical protein
MSEPEKNKKLVDQTYVVQRADTVQTEEPRPWYDVATVTVPGRTQRKTVVEKALTEAGIVPKVGDSLLVRVLAAESFATITVESELLGGYDHPLIKTKYEEVEQKVACLLAAEFELDVTVDVDPPF